MTAIPMEIQENNAPDQTSNAKFHKT